MSVPVVSPSGYASVSPLPQRPQAADGELGAYGWFPLTASPQPLFEPMRPAIAALLTGPWYFPQAAPPVL